MPGCSSPSTRPTCGTTPGRSWHASLTRSGPANYNKNLSERRAVQVADWLSDQEGIARSRITVVAHGEAEPVADNRTAAGRRLNRCVVVVVLP
jgi:outer membrane protein OmpA-like peptidoglycan-associated protein